MWFKRRPPSEGRNVDRNAASGQAGGSQVAGRWVYNDADRAEETMRALQQGVLPRHVRERIDRGRKGEGPWSSTLSVNEWALLAPKRFKPLGMVAGSCFYHVGYTVSSSAGAWVSHDLTYLEHALYDARQLALTRLAQEAAAYGAHAVVGVRLDMRQPGFEGHETEFVATGTAVRLDDVPVPLLPVLCTVSGQDLVKLLAVGSIPVGVAMGVCIHYQYTSWQDTWQQQSWYNQEVGVYSEAVYYTRNKAVQQMWQDARRLDATGVLAEDTDLHVMDIEVERGEDDERDDHVLEFLAIGTAVHSGPVPEHLRPRLVLALQD